MQFFEGDTKVVNVVIKEPNTSRDVHFNSHDPSFRKFHNWFKDAVFEHIAPKESDNSSGVRFTAGRYKDDEVGREGEKFTHNVFIRSMHLLNVNNIMLITESTEKSYFLFSFIAVNA